MRALALLALLAGCGSITAGAGAGDDAGDAGAELARRDALGEAHRDAGAECPPTGLICTGVQGACPAGRAVAKRSDCGGAPFSVCCPVADCELAACEPCPSCPL